MGCFQNLLSNCVKNSVTRSTKYIRKLKSSRRLSRSIKDLNKYIKKSSSINSCKPLNLYERACMGVYDDKTDDIYGDELLSMVLKTMGEFGQGRDRIKLRIDQRTMLAHALNALLPLLYKEKLEANRDRLLKQLGLKQIQEQKIIIASRRAGKTMFMSMLIASLMICVPQIEIAVFSLGKRASQKVMRLVVDMLNRHPKGAEMIVRSNQEQLMLCGDKPYHYKLLHGFPDTVHVCIIIYFFFLFIIYFPKKKIVAYIFHKKKK